MPKKVKPHNTDKSARYTDARIKKAIKESGGMVATAARKLRCSLVTVYNRMERNPEIAEAFKFEKELLKDKIEKTLYSRAIDDGEIAALIFLAKTQAKDRGYTERPEYQPVQQVVVQQANVAEAQTYDYLLTMLRTLTAAKVLPPGVLASFVIPRAIDANGYDHSGNGEMPT